MSAMIKYLHKQATLGKRKRYVHSEVDSNQGKQLLSNLDVQFELVHTIPLATGQWSSIDPYKWEGFIATNGEEVVLSEEQQRKRCRKYVEDNIGARVVTWYPVNRLKLGNILPPIGEDDGNSGISEFIKRYYDIVSVSGSDLDIAKKFLRPTSMLIIYASLLVSPS
ncbi:hypothetical protein Plhal703r1_c17g0078091 [Plasmopara halstedii]